ncbi:MAG: hypothetical protein ACI8QS_000854 [Planctomycetota bacterium]
MPAVRHRIKIDESAADDGIYSVRQNAGSRGPLSIQENPLPEAKQATDGGIRGDSEAMGSRLTRANPGDRSTQHSDARRINHDLAGATRGAAKAWELECGGVSCDEDNRQSTGGDPAGIGLVIHVEAPAGIPQGLEAPRRGNQTVREVEATGIVHLYDRGILVVVRAAGQEGRVRSKLQERAVVLQEVEVNQGTRRQHGEYESPMLYGRCSRSIAAARNGGYADWGGEYSGTECFDSWEADLRNPLSQDHVEQSGGKGARRQAKGHLQIAPKIVQTPGHLCLRHRNP